MKTNYTTQPEKAYEKPGEWGTVLYTSISYEMPALNTFVEKGYSNEYLTTVALEDGTISFNVRFDMGTEYITSISYSTDNGKTWTTTANQDDKEENLVIDVNVNKDDKVLWKGIATQTGCWSSNDSVDDVVGSFFSSNCEFNASGNVMSLLYGDNFRGETTIKNSYEFAWLFSDYDAEKECLVVNAKDLSLSATTLANSCYLDMFLGCTSLISVPKLPATTLANYCYGFMFMGCSSLTTAPELPATTLANSCYDNMFLGCTSLNNITCLATDITADHCTSYWVDDVAEYGTFTKAASMSNWTTGRDGIPIGWTVQDEMKEESIEAPASYSVSEVMVGAVNVEKGSYMGIVNPDTAIYVYGVGLSDDIVKLFNLTLGTEQTHSWVSDEDVQFETTDDNGIYQLTIGGEMWCQFFIDA